jgi:hypothetical protein
VNIALVFAAGLVIAVGAAHSYLGERYILIRLFRRPDLPHLFGSDVFTRRTLRLAWHLTTVIWWGVAVLLLVAASSSRGAVSLRDFGLVLTATSIVSAVISFLISRGRHLSWLAFLAIAALCWWGTR